MLILNPKTVIIGALCVFAIAYRIYGGFLGKKVLKLDASRQTPASTMADGRDYKKTNRFVLFLQHFAAIAGAGPLIGPVLAAQFGFLPGILWILIGAVFAGAAHDAIIIFVSVRHGGKSLAGIAREELGTKAGIITMVLALAVLTLLISTAAIVIVNALQNSSWGTFIVATTIPVAVVMGFIMRDQGKRSIIVATAIGLISLFLATLFGDYITRIPIMASIFNIDREIILVLLLFYALTTSILPVWLLLTPRDYLSSFLKIFTILILVGGIVYLKLPFRMPGLTTFINGGGPVIPGSVFPFVMITIACGAISGFHSFISTGNTPKQIGSEKDIIFVGYGAMLVEGIVALVALTAACVLCPQDYFAINSTAGAYAKTGMIPVDLPWLSTMVKEQLQARPGGAVAFATGVAYIFSQIPYMDSMIAYWYHFAIMFEAVFILTLVDAGTRSGRFLIQEVAGNLFPRLRFSDNRWTTGVVISSCVFTVMWGTLLFKGSIPILWPLAGTSNQLLATCSLFIASTMLMRINKFKCALVTIIPGVILFGVSMWASYLNISVHYLPKGLYLMTVLSFIMIILTASVVLLSVKQMLELGRRKCFVSP